MSILNGFFNWALCELLLTTAMAFLYIGFRTQVKNASERYVLLKFIFFLVPILPLLPLLPISWISINSNQLPSHELQKAFPLVVQGIEFLNPASNHLFSIFVSCFAAVYLVLVLVRFTLLMKSFHKIYHLRRGADTWSTRNGVPVLTTSASFGPAACGWLKPFIIIPKKTLSDLSACELEWVLIHEEQHILRHDHSYNMLRSFMQIILVFCPAIHWLGGRFVEEMEMSCDALTLEHGNSSVRSYAELLFRLSRYSDLEKATVAFPSSQAFITRRIGAMKNVGSKSRKLILLAGLVLISLVSTPLMLAARELKISVADSPDKVAPLPGANKKSYKFAIDLALNEKPVDSFTVPVPYNQELSIMLGRGDERFSAGEKDIILQLKPTRIDDNGAVQVRVNIGHSKDGKSIEACASTQMIMQENVPAELKIPAGTTQNCKEAVALKLTVQTS